MAKRVNSFSDLFQAGPSENPIFEGLDEIIPPSMLNSADASMPTEPQPQPQPQPLPQAPILVADPPAEPEAVIGAQSVTFLKCFPYYLAMI